MIGNEYDAFSDCFQKVLTYEKVFLRACLDNFINLQNISQAKELVNSLQKSIELFEKKTVKLDEDNILITASHTELQRRIGSFIRNQRHKINILNSYEFGGGEKVQEFSCARTDSVYKPSFGKSHVKMRQVTNHRGPQTLHEQQLEVLPSAAVLQRVNNLQQHIKLSSDPCKAEAAMPRGVYERLKELEERVMLLEGVSPELFNYYYDHHNDDDDDDNFGI